MANDIRFKEMKEVEPLQSITDSTQLLGYDSAANKYGLVAVGKINQTTWCGCRWRKDSTSPVGEPCGSLPKIERMADLFGLGGYLVQNDHSRRKLSREDHNYFADGGRAQLDGSMGHYQWGSGVTIYYACWEDDTYEYEAIDTVPIPGQLNYRVPVFSRSCAGFATIDRTNLVLVSYVNSAPQYRGGNNNAAIDEAYNSQLGMPATNISAQTAAGYARKNGDLWFCNERVAFAVTGILKRIFFHNRSIQAAVNNTLTADGLHQGGTGEGCDTPSNWQADWSQYPYIPLSAGIENGDMTGVFSVDIDNNGTPNTVSGIPSFLGLKNDYKYLGAFEEDTLLRNNADGSQSVFVDTMVDGHRFNEASEEGHVLLGTLPTGSAKGYLYIKKIRMANLFPLPSAVGATASTGFGDAYYWPNEKSGFRGAYRLGDALGGPTAGSVFLLGNYAPSAAFAYYGAVLCEFKEAFSTEPSLIA